MDCTNKCQRECEKCLAFLNLRSCSCDRHELNSLWNFDLVMEYDENFLGRPRFWYEYLRDHGPFLCVFHYYFSMMHMVETSFSGTLHASCYKCGKGYRECLKLYLNRRNSCTICGRGKFYKKYNIVEFISSEWRDIPDLV